MLCNKCAYADWQRTSDGKRLHSNKQGICRYLERNPLDLRLPWAFYWLWNPEPCGGQIERDKVLIKAGKLCDCPFFAEVL